MNINLTTRQDGMSFLQSSPYPTSETNPRIIPSCSVGKAARGDSNNNVFSSHPNEACIERSDIKKSKVIAWRGFCEREKRIKWDPKQSTVLTKKYKDISLVDIKLDEVGPYDVVFIGRGGTGYKVLRKKKEHCGYVWYRSMIEIVRPGFLLCHGKKERMKLSRWIVNKVRDFGGRFIEKEKKTGLYKDVGDSVAQMRTSMALRDQRQWKTMLQACTDDFDLYGNILMSIRIEDIFRECEIDVSKLRSSVPSTDPSIRGVPGIGVVPSAVPSAATPTTLVPSPPFYHSASAGMPIGVTGSLCNAVLPKMLSPSLGGNMMCSPVSSPATMKRETFGSPSIGSRPRLLDMEKQILQHEIMRERQTILMRQERLAQLEVEQQMVLQRDHPLQYRASYGNSQRHMWELQMMRHKIYQDAMMQDQLDARLAERDLEQRALMSQRLPQTIVGSVRGQQWDPQMMMTDSLQDQHLFQSHVPLRGGWGVTRQDLLGDKAIQCTKQEERSYKLQRKTNVDETSDQSCSYEDGSQSEDESQG
ncbi:hypothetical protein IV203_007141 [Nitzschia inconspicua]|uniref:DUF6824 domain-containing protein n=1 Tax=Nitzschia inconspicua TaxID=303405 RepID=A0A9K3KE53_9STRA|nr:hypothetical protein IV203_007141 [Nitzschia inconspicua]